MNRRPNPIVDQLARARAQRGISVAALGHRLLTAAPTVHGWESGKHDPRLGSVIAYAEALGYELVLAPKQHRTRPTLPKEPRRG
ncbi:helix-turn-helix domain-containing protein [Nocardiopsis ganjiahuensis]|uniref:helix-turn-helix domain-containing protein n=1 Tax=Nocardiopsis ganjiahuensis TaxID=239984 RepID=UPI00034A4A1F|nr:helix-turn-helix transcriptional regulator [Nocardiopsis ganjiahuensis]